MAQQIKHIPAGPAIEAFSGSPLTLLRARVLSLATLNVRQAVALVQCRFAELTKTITWLEHSYLMRKVQGGWRLTATGERALRDTFRVVCEGGTVCGQCHRLHAPGAFLGKKGVPVKYCASCRERALLSDVRGAI